MGVGASGYVWLGWVEYLASSGAVAAGMIAPITTHGRGPIYLFVCLSYYAGECSFKIARVARQVQKGHQLGALLRHLRRAMIVHVGFNENVSPPADRPTVHTNTHNIHLAPT